MMMMLFVIIIVVVVNKCHREIIEVLNEEEHVLLSSLYCSLQKHISVKFDAFHDHIYFTKEFEKLESFLFKTVW